MKHFPLSILCCLLSIGTIQAQNNVILTVKNPSINCNYLIISPPQFLQGAQMLASYRAGGSGYKTGIIITDSLYSQFNQVNLKQWQKIWLGLQWAYSNWTVKPDYIVLLGADSLVLNPDDSSWANLGSLPTPAVGSTTEYSTPDLKITPIFGDQAYANLEDTLPGTNSHNVTAGGNYKIAVGRIPCYTLLQCTTYIRKVINFEKTDGIDRSWRNNAILITDDHLYRGNLSPFQTGFLRDGEGIADSGLNGWFISKLHGCTCTSNDQFFTPQETDDYFSVVNAGALWSLFIGCGSASLLTDEHVITSSDAPRFNNIDKPTIFFCLTSEFGNFTKQFDSSIAKQFLFLPGSGAVACIGATQQTYESSNFHFGKSFTEIRRQYPAASLGMSVAIASYITRDPYISSYEGLGDPALIIGGNVIEASITKQNANIYHISTPSVISISTPSYICKILRSDSLHGMVSGSYPGSDFEYSYLRDTLLWEQSGVLSNGATSLTIPPSCLGIPRTRLSVFVWRGADEGRVQMDLTLNSDIHPTIRTSAFHIQHSIDFSGESLRLNSTGSASSVRITIFTLDGKMVFTRTLSLSPKDARITLALGNLSRGSHLAKAVFSDGNVVLSKFTVLK